MKNSQIFDELERNGVVIGSLLSGLKQPDREWKPAINKWNVLEVICHLYDEEKDDFRERVRSILKDPNEPLTPIDPAGWVEQRKYAFEDFDVKLNNFVEEREASVKWLRSLKSPKWDNAFQHPKIGAMSAQLVLENWLAHDLLHIRQILGLKYGYLKANIQNPLDYAGDW